MHTAAGELLTEASSVGGPEVRYTYAPAGRRGRRARREPGPFECSRFFDVKTDVGVALDLLGWLGVRRATPLLQRAAQHPEPWVALWGSVGVLRGGEAVAPALLHRVASAADCRVALMRQLDELGMKSLFPPEFLDQASLAEGRMVEWLAFPTELARAPDEIKLERVFAVDLDEGPADIYVYAFRVGVMSDEGWMVGVSGPYLRDAQPTIEDRGVTFSQFQNLQQKALEQHVEEIIDAVARIRRS